MNNAVASSSPSIPPPAPTATIVTIDTSARAYLPPHIVVLVHGNNGAPSDFDTVESALLRKFGTAQVLTIKSAANHTQTALGVEIGGTRLAEEIYQTIFQYELHPDVNRYKLSIVAHSLGGLYARFAIVQLIASLAPLNMEYVSFVTMCTPHLGSRRPRGGSTLKNVWRMGVHTVLGSRTIYGQTGIDLLVDIKKPVDESDASDSDDNGAPAPPLLESMCRPDSEFITALQQFHFGTLVAMTDGDVVVPYASASIRNFNPYPSNTLTDRFSDWRWHVHHSGFAPTAADDENSDERYAMFLHKLANRVDHDVEIADCTLGLDVTVSPRYASVDGYDADNKQEVEFSYDMIASLQQAMAWRRIDITVEPHGVKGKLRLHDWPINKMQPSGCRANEFIDLVCDMLGCDHAMDALPPSLDTSSDEQQQQQQQQQQQREREQADSSAVGKGITRIFEKFQKRSESNSQPSHSGASSSDEHGSGQLSPTAGGGVGAEPSPAVSDGSRGSFVSAAGLNRLLGKFQRKDSFLGLSSATTPASVQPSPLPSPSGASASAAGRTSDVGGGDSETTRNSLSAGFTQMLDRFQRRVVKPPTLAVAATVAVAAQTTASTASESVESTESVASSTPLSPQPQQEQQAGATEDAISMLDVPATLLCS